MTTRGYLLGAVLLALPVSLAGAGCGGDDSDPVAETGASTDPLPIEGRVIADGLGGLPPTGEIVVAATPQEYSRATDEPELALAKEAAALTAAGFRHGAVVEFGAAEGPPFGRSAAVEYGSPQQARSELQRIFTEGLAAETPPGAQVGSLPSVPGSRTLMAGGMDSGGGPFELSAAFFTDGPFLYGELAGGAPDQIDGEAVLDEASALYERVAGRPAP